VTGTEVTQQALGGVALAVLTYAVVEAAMRWRRWM
jgi:hypothetical protein